MANVVKELSAKAVFSIDGFLGKMNSLEKSIDSLPNVTEKATSRMNDSFGDVSKSLSNFDEMLKKSGKDFDTKAVQSELQKAQKEFAETGNVTAETMKSLNKEINNVEWKNLDVKSRTEFKKVKAGVKTVERSMNKLNDVKFLESLPEDARLAGAKLLDLEKNAGKVQKSLEKVGSDTDLTVLNKDLADARKELLDTGKMSESTMQRISTSVKNVDVDALPDKFKGAFDKVGQQADNLKSTLSDIGKSDNTAELADGMSDIAANAGKAEGATGLLEGALGAIKGGGYVAVIGGIAAGITAIGKGALESKNAINELSVQTGATGKELEGLKKVMQDIYANNFGDGLADIADVLSTVKTATNLTGKELQKATENAILMRDSFEWEPEETMNAVRAMMKNFNLTHEEAFNLLTQGRQQMGKGADDLLDTFKEYGSAFHEIGLSGQDSMNMMNNAMDAGIINTDKAADAINEMSILMREMPEDTADGMKLLGLNARDVQTAFAQGGDKAREMFFKVTGALRDMKDPVEQNAVGIATFGTMWEDAGAEAILALGKTDGKIKQSKDALKSLNDVKYDNIGSALQGVGRSIVGNVLLPIQDKMMPGINAAIKTVSQFASKIKGAFEQIKNTKGVNILMKLGFSNGQANNIINWFNGLKKQLSIAGGAVKGFFQLFKGNGTQGVITLTKLGLKPETIQQISGFADKIKKTFSEAFGAVASFAKKGMGEVMKFFAGPDGKQLMQAIRNIGNVIGTVMKSIWAVMKFVWPAVKMLIVSVWNNIKGVISGGLRVIKGLIQVFSGLFTGDFRKMWQGVKNIFFGAIKLVWNYVQLMFFGKLLKGGLGFIKLFAGGLKGMWTKIVGLFKTQGGSILKNTVNIFKSLYNGINKIFSNIVKFLFNATKSLVKNVLGFFKWLATGSSKQMTALKNSLIKIWSALKTYIPATAKFIKDKVVGFFKALWTNLTDRMTSLKKFLTSGWSNIRESAVNAASKLKDGVVKNFENLKKGIDGWIGKIKSGVGGMKDEVIKQAKKMKDGLKDKVIGGLNLMIDGVNWVAKGLHIDPPLQRIDPAKYSTGTGGHPGGLATVGDKGPGNGKGTRELVMFPNGRTALFEQETTFMMPKGTHVLSNRETEPILEAARYSTGTPKAGGGPSLIDKAKAKWNDIKAGVAEGYEKVANFTSDALKGTVHKAVGTSLKLGNTALHNSNKLIGEENTKKVLDTAAAVGEGTQDIMQYMGNPGGLLNSILKKFGVDFSGIKGLPGQFMSKLYGKLKTGAVNKIKEWFDSAGGGDGGFLDMSYGVNFGFMPSAAQAAAAGYPYPRAHLGLDIDYPQGTKVYSTTSGTATGSYGWGGGFGNHMWVKNGALDVIYGHLHKLAFEGTKQVKPGTFLGWSGGNPAVDGQGAGSSSGAHLHYEMRRNGVAFDPTNWIKQNNGGGKGGNDAGGSGYAYAKSIIQKAQSLLGGRYTDSSITDNMLKLAKRESNYQPNIVNDWDVNARNGTPSKGMFQMIEPTFRANAAPGHGNFGSTLDQAMSAMRYIVNRYGWGGFPRAAAYAYADGGIITRPHYGLVGEAGPEAIIPLSKNKRKQAEPLLAKANRAVYGEPAKYASGTKRMSRVRNLKDLGTSLINKGTRQQDVKTSKSDIAIGKLITSAINAITNGSLNSIYAKVQGIAKKVNTSLKSNDKKIASNIKKMGTLNKSNKEERKRLVYLAKQRKSAKNKAKIDQLQRKSWNKIKKNNAAIKNLKEENNLYKLQNQNLNTIKQNELLKTDVLKKMMAKRDDLAKKLADRKSAYKQLLEEKTSFKDSLQGSMMEYAGFGNAKGNTARDLVAYMKYRYARLQKFAKNVTKLKKMGLSPALLRDILAGGVDSAMPRVEMLVGTGKGYIGQINGMEGRIEKLTATLSGQEAGYAYNDGLKRNLKQQKAIRQSQNVLNAQARKYVNSSIRGKRQKVASSLTQSKPSKTASTVNSMAKKATEYVIKWGDTLTSIAKKFSSTINAIAKANGIKNVNKIYAGSKIKIPGYATGGIISRPQLAWIAEGGFAESIISHDPRRRVSQQRIWEQTGRDLGFNADDKLTRRLIALQEESNAIQREIAAKRSVIQLDKTVVGREVADTVDTTIATKNRYENRGLANGR